MFLSIKKNKASFNLQVLNVKNVVDELRRFGDGLENIVERLKSLTLRPITACVVYAVPFSMVIFIVTPFTLNSNKINNFYNVLCSKQKHV